MRFSLVQVQRHGLFGHRGPQPFDLLPRRQQLGLLGRLARPTRHRRRERVQRALLRRPADVHHSGPVDTEALGRLALGGLRVACGACGQGLVSGWA